MATDSFASETEQLNWALCTSATCLGALAEHVAPQRPISHLRASVNDRPSKGISHLTLPASAYSLTSVSSQVALHQMLLWKTPRNGHFLFVELQSAILPRKPHASNRRQPLDRESRPFARPIEIPVLVAICDQPAVVAPFHGIPA